MYKILTFFYKILQTQLLAYNLYERFKQERGKPVPQRHAVARFRLGFFQPFDSANYARCISLAKGHKIEKLAPLARKVSASFCSFSFSSVHLADASQNQTTA